MTRGSRDLHPAGTGVSGGNGVPGDAGFCGDAGAPGAGASVTTDARAGTPASAHAQPPTFHTPVGTVTGWHDADVIRATGIPYAQASRFERPTPVLSLDDVASAPGREPSAPGEPFAATEFSPSAPQVIDENFGAIFGPELRDLGMSEDCLRLSVTIPGDLAEGERVPVVVWIHGGTYVAGSGDSSLSDPSTFVADQRVIVVAVTYRMGVFGFLSSSRSPANLGLLDQREAFRWVRRNIAAFGGDPGQVTAMGESAGADAIVHLMAAMGHGGAGTELLFDRAILMSPPLGIRHGRARMTDAMSAAVDVAITDDMPHAEVLKVQERVFARAVRFGLPGMMPFGTQYGHDPLPAEEEIGEAWARIAPKIPVLIGTLGTETSLFAHTMPAAQAVHKVPVVGEAAYWKLVDLTSSIVFVKPARDFAEMWRESGGEAHLYAMGWSVLGNSIRSPHALDVAILFADEDTYRDVVPFEGATWDEVATARDDLGRYFGEFARGEALHPLTKEPRVIRSA